MIVVSIPILDFSSKFEVYNVHNFPVALANTSRQADNRYFLTAQLDLDSSILALNNERTKYIMLNYIEVRECSNPWLSFCEFQSPVYSVGLHKSCVISLYLKQKRNQDKYCKTIVHFDPKLPTAEFIGHENWLVATSQSLQFSVVCHNKYVTSVQVSPPVGILHVQTSCVASNSFFSLISPFDGRSKYELRNTMSEFMNIRFDKIQFNLWRPLHATFQNMTSIKIPDRLKNIKSIPMETLIRELRTVRPLQSPGYELPSWVYFLIAIIVAFAFLAVVTVYCKCKHKIRPYWLAKRVRNGRRKSESPLPSHHVSALDKTGGTDTANHMDTVTLHDKDTMKLETFPQRKRTLNIDVLSV